MRTTTPAVLVLTCVLSASTAAASPPELQLQRRHGGTVYAVAVSPDGSLVASGGSDGDVKLWLAESGELWRDLVRHGGWVNALAFSPDGRILASVSNDSTLRFWEVDSGRALDVRKIETGPVNDVAFDPHGDFLATADAGNVVRIWDTASREGLYALRPHGLEVPDGVPSLYSSEPKGAVSLVFDTEGDRLVSGHSEHGLVLLDLVAGRSSPAVEGYAATPYAIAFSPDGGRLVAAGADGQVRFWDSRTREPLEVLEGHTGTVSGLAFSPSDGSLVSVSHDDTIRWWDEGSEQDLRCTEQRIRDVAMDPQGRFLVTAEGAEPRIRDTRTKETLHELGGFWSTVNALAFSPDGRHLVVGTSSPAIVVLDLATGRLDRQLSGHRHGVSSLAFSPDGSWLSSMSLNTLRLWRWPSGDPAAAFELGTEDREDTEDSVETDGKTSVEELVDKISFDLAFSPDGKTLATVGFDGLVTLWDVAEGRRRAAFEVDGIPLGVTFSRDGRRLAAATLDKDGGYRVWDLATEEVVADIAPPFEFRDGRPVDIPFGRSVLFSADGRSLFGGLTNGLVKLWDVESGHSLATVEHGRDVTDLVLSPDGRRLASGSPEADVRIWNAETLELVQRLDGHGSGVKAIAFARDGRSLAVGGGDGTVRLWRLADGKLLTRTHLLADGEYLTETPEGDFVASPGVDRHCRWRLGRRLDAFAVHAEARRRPDLVEQALAERSALSVGPLEPELSRVDRDRLADAERLDQGSDQLAEEGRYQEAAEQAEKALALKRELYGDAHREVALALHRLGRQLLRLSRYTRAEELYLQALEIWEAQGAEKSEHAKLLSSLGELYRRLGQRRKAYSYQLRAYDTWHQSSKELLFYFQIRNRLGLALAGLGQAENAETVFSKTLGTIESMAVGDEHLDQLIQNPLKAEVFDHLAELNRSLSRDHKAEELWRHSLELRSGTPRPSSDQKKEAVPIRQSGSHFGLGRIAAKRGLVGQARQHFEKALELTTTGVGPGHPRIARIQGELALLEADERTRLDKAVALLGEALRIETDFLESVFLQSTELEKIALLESEQTAGHFFDQLLTLALKLDDASPALARVYGAVQERRLLTLRTRSRQLESYFSGSEASAGLLREYRELSRQISALHHGTPPRFLNKARLEAFRQRREELEDEMAAASSGFELDQRLRRADTAEILRSLPEGATLVEFVRHRPDSLGFGLPGERYMAFVATHAGRLAARDLGPARDVDSLVEAYRKKMDDFRPKHLGIRDRREAEEDLAELTGELYHRLFEPLLSAERGAPLLPASGTVFLAPEGPLLLVPFETWTDGEGRYLVERYQFNYLGSGRDLLRFRDDAVHETGGFYVFADPEYGEGERFQSLKETAAFAETLRGLFGLGAGQVFTGPAANEDNFLRLERPGRIHVATHGFYVPSAPGTPGNPLLNAGLAFAGANRIRLRPSPGDRTDGIVTALEISTLDLRGTDLVVLSACETGVGEVRAGEGVFGLSRSFRAAGARSVVLSLWQVEERATEQLMTRFYQGLGEGLGKCAALRAAALDLKAGRSTFHPYFWGAFVCTGDPA